MNDATAEIIDIRHKSARQHRHPWQLPATVRAVIPAELLPAPARSERRFVLDDGELIQFGAADDDDPFQQTSMAVKPSRGS
ncbi:MAG: hypothetical protein ACREHV_11615 [Rhizomicrobium sp.]